MCPCSALVGSIKVIGSISSLVGCWKLTLALSSSGAHLSPVELFLTYQGSRNGFFGREENMRPVMHGTGAIVGAVRQLRRCADNGAGLAETVGPN